MITQEQIIKLIPKKISQSDEALILGLYQLVYAEWPKSKLRRFLNNIVFWFALRKKDCQLILCFNALTSTEKYKPLSYDERSHLKMIMMDLHELQDIDSSDSHREYCETSINIGLIYSPLRFSLQDRVRTLTKQVTKNAAKAKQQLACYV
jgi:hypothetical protein